MKLKSQILPIWLPKTTQSDGGGYTANLGQSEVKVQAEPRAARAKQESEQQESRSSPQPAQEDLKQLHRGSKTTPSRI